VSALAGRRVLVTGGSSGLGAALAAACADAGARVAIVARGRDRLDEVAGATGALAVVADVGDAEAAQGAVA
jgi:NADP-dependent 3-hydroxy acid dehydrogenase YdfG